MTSHVSACILRLIANNSSVICTVITQAISTFAPLPLRLCNCDIGKNSVSLQMRNVFLTIILSVTLQKNEIIA